MSLSSRIVDYRWMQVHSIPYALKITSKMKVKEALSTVSLMAILCPSSGLFSAKLLPEMEQVLILLT